MHKLDNLVTFVDYNKVQLSGSMDDVMKTRIKKLFDA
jgi:transketolase N-terminal domain/subunit